MLTEGKGLCPHFEREDLDLSMSQLPHFTHLGLAHVLYGLGKPAALSWIESAEAIQQGVLSSGCRVKGGWK